MTFRAGLAWFARGRVGHPAAPSPPKKKIIKTILEIPIIFVISVEGMQKGKERLSFLGIKKIEHIFLQIKLKKVKSE